MSISNHYKHGNGRLQLRAAGGQFRRGSLGDFGLATNICPICGALNPYEEYSYVGFNGFTQRMKNDPPTTCEHCGYRWADAAAASNGDGEARDE